MKWIICILVPILLVLPSVCGQLAGLRNSSFQLYTDKKKWKDAKSYCEAKHVNLATIRSQKDNDLFPNLSVWIGLYRDKSDGSWKWSGGDETPIFKNWNDLEPNNLDTEECVNIWYNGKWYNSDCDHDNQFICMDEKLILVKENKTWEEALGHCRSMGSDDTTNPDSQTPSYDLVTLISDDDHDYARERAQEATTDAVWTGLRYLGDAWFWVGGEPVQYPNIQTCPVFGCGVLEKNSNTAFDTGACSKKQNFFCQKKPYNS